MDKTEKETPAPFERDKEANIYQRLAAVMQEVRYVQKDAEVQLWNNGPSYKATSHDGVTRATRPALIKHGVLAVPRDYVWERLPDQVTKNRDKERRVHCVTLSCVVRFVNIDKPDDFVDVPSYSEGQDAGDKAPGKAISMAVKYGVLKGLMLETGDHEEERIDADPVDDGPAEQQRNQSGGEVTSKRREPEIDVTSPAFWDDPVIPLTDKTWRDGKEYRDWRRWAVTFRAAGWAALDTDTPLTSLGNLLHTNDASLKAYINDSAEPDATEKWIEARKAEWYETGNNRSTQDADE